MHPLTLSEHFFAAFTAQRIVRAFCTDLLLCSAGAVSSQEASTVGAVQFLHVAGSVGVVAAETARNFAVARLADAVLGELAVVAVRADGVLRVGGDRANLAVCD